MKLRTTAALLLALLAFAGCAASPAAPTEPAATDTAPAAAASTPAPTATPNPSPTQVPSDTPTTAPMTPSDLFDKVSPSVAFIETERGSGSGVLIDDGYVVTNAHVVWPFTEVRVVFPDGSEFTDAPVLAWDLIGDLAVVGPIETDISPVTFLTDERLLVGKDVYLIGYPGEVDKFPQPTISRGLVARLRNWPAIDMTYLQTDATIAGGQSGGVLVSDRGEVAGISGNFFPDTSFALVASAQDVLKRVDGLIAGENVDGLGRRPVLDEAEADTHHMLVMSDNLASQSFTFNGVKGEEVEIDVDAVYDYAFLVIDPLGQIVAYANDTETGTEHARFDTEHDGMYVVDVYQFENHPSAGSISSTAELTPLMDWDDRKRPVIGEAIPGNIDFINDIDPYRIFLNQDQEITVRVESVMIDPLVMVDMEAIQEDDDEPPYDDDSGKGLFGMDAEMSYRAPADGIYHILVESATNSETGGYFLTVNEAQAGDPTPMAPEPTPTPIRSAQGNMTRYESEGTPTFRIDHPTDWYAVSPSSATAVLCRFVTYCRATTDEQVVLLIAEERLADYNLGDITLEDYAALTQEVIESQPGSPEVTRSEVITNTRGIPLHVLEYELATGRLRAVRLMTIHKGVAFNATIIMPAVPPGADDSYRQSIEQQHRRMDAIIEHMIDSFLVQD